MGFEARDPGERDSAGAGTSPGATRTRGRRAGRVPRGVRSGGGPAALPLLLSLALVSAAGCGGEPASGGSGGSDAFTARDSADVRVVDADWDRLPVLDSVDPDPAFTVGEEGDDLAVSRVRAARILPDGRVAVGFGASPTVVVVDPATGEATTVAEAGDGPAELGSVASLHLEAGGERLGVYDPRRRRYVVFDLDGELVEHRSLRDVWPGRGGPAVTMWAPPVFLPDEDSTFHVGARADVPPSEGTGRAELPLLRVRGSRIDTVTRYRGRQFFRRGREVGPVLLGPEVALAASPEGIWIGDTGSPSVARWSGPGAPELVLRWRRDLDRSLTREDVRGLVDRLMAQVPESQRRAARRYAEKPPVPDRLPAYGKLLVDDRGVLWVGEHYGVDLPPRLRLLPDDPGEWALFASDGTPLGRVVTPPRTQVLDIGTDGLVGVHQGELGVETVRLYRVER